MALELTFDGATDPDGVYAEIADLLKAELPGIDLADVDLETALMRAFAQSGSVTRTLLVDRLLADYRRFGQVIHQLPVLDGSRAVASTTWTLRDTGAPIIIPAGLPLAWPSPAGDVQFTLTNQINADAGVTTVADVTVTAVDLGTTPHSLALAPLRLAQPLGVVVVVQATTVPAGGSNLETAGEYEDRLSERIQLYGETLIVPEDFAKAARQHPQVGRALAIDLYNPTTGTFANPRTLTVALADIDGQPLPASVADEVAASISDPSWRIANEVTYTIGPDYTAVAIMATVTLKEGAAPNTVALARERVYAYLSPAGWPWGSTVTHDEIFYVLRDTPGIETVPTLTLNGGTADVTLAGVAPLPAPADNPTAPTTVTIGIAP